MRKKLKDEIRMLVKKRAELWDETCDVVCFYNSETKRVEAITYPEFDNFFSWEILSCQNAGEIGRKKIKKYFYGGLVLARESLNDFKEDFPYSGIDSLDKIDGCTEERYIDYMCLYLKNANTEKIIKVYPDLIFQIHTTEDFCIFNKCFKSKGSSMKEITGLPDRTWKLLVEKKVSLFVWNQVRIWDKQTFKEEEKHLENEDVETIIEIGGGYRKKSLTDFKYIIKHAVDEKGKKLFTVSKLNRYLERVDMYQAIGRYTAIEILRDYVEMCNHLEIVPVTDSNSLKREHDVTARLHSEYARKKWEEKENKRLQEQLQKFENVYPELEKYVYENDELKVIVPHTPKDMIDESRMNRNCMSSYIDRFADGLSKIFFIRRKDNPDISYISVELNSTLTDYRQAYYACNQSVTKKSDLAFIKSWLENNKKLRLQNA